MSASLFVLFGEMSIQALAHFNQVIGLIFTIEFTISLNVLLRSMQFKMTSQSNKEGSYEYVNGKGKQAINILQTL